MRRVLIALFFIASSALIAAPAAAQDTDGGEPPTTTTEPNPVVETTSPPETTDAPTPGDSPSPGGSSTPGESSGPSTGNSPGPDETTGPGGTSGDELCAEPAPPIVTTADAAAVSAETAQEEGVAPTCEPAAQKLAANDVGALAKDPDNEKKHTICHRTNSNNNPYNVITVSANSIVKNSGHDSHNGPVWDPTLKDQGIKWGDIIPEFDYNEGQDHYDGKNTDALDLIENGCNVPGEQDDDDGTPSDDDGDDGDDDDGDDDDKGPLPATGGGSPLILLIGGLLTVFGIAILGGNGSMGRMMGSVGPVPSGSWSYPTGRHLKK